MKKSKIVILIFILVLLFNFNAYADDIKVYVNSVEVKFDVPPIIENGRTLVPMRAIFEALGAEVLWDADTKTAAAYIGDLGVAVQVNNFYANKDNTAVELDVAPKIINGRMLVPLRFVGEAFGNVVKWNGENRTITIGSNDAELPNEPINKVESGIVGNWSTTHHANLRVDVYSGMPLDDYSGSWYVFRENGTYNFIMTGSGLVINGTVSHSGKYTIDYKNGKIKFYDNKESWLPTKATDSLKAYSNKSVEDYTVAFEINDEEQTLKIGSKSFTSLTTYMRIISE